MGQERIVHVHRFRCKDTVEEALDQILDSKSETFANIVDALAAEVTLTDSASKELLAKAPLVQLVLRQLSQWWWPCKATECPE